MGTRGTDALSEALEASPGWARGPMRAASAIQKFVRVFIALQAVGGVVSIVIGAVTLDGILAIRGFGQLLLAGVVFSIGGGSEHVIEATGPAGSYVVRAGPHRRWKDLRGFARVPAMVTGDQTWRATVRKREDDPFGPAVTTAEAPTQRALVLEARELERRIKTGEQLDGSPSGDDHHSDDADHGEQPRLA